MDRAGWGMEQGEVFTLSETGNREPWKVSARGWVRLGSPARQPWECSEQGMSWHWHPRCCPYCARPVHEEGTGRATQVHLSSCYKQAELCLRKEREAKNIYEQQKKEKKTKGNHDRDGTAKTLEWEHYFQFEQCTGKLGEMNMIPRRSSQVPAGLGASPFPDGRHLSDLGGRDQPTLLASSLTIASTMKWNLNSHIFHSTVPKDSFPSVLYIPRVEVLPPLTL